MGKLNFSFSIECCLFVVEIFNRFELLLREISGG
jgi:hypothetical protein